MRLTQVLFKKIPDWYHLQQSSSSFFKKQAIIYMNRFQRKAEWSQWKHARNRYNYHLKGEQFYAADRSNAKRDINRMRVAAACEEHGFKYSYLQPTLAKLDINLNLYSLARLSIYEPKTFKCLVDIAREASSENLPPANFNVNTMDSSQDMPRIFAIEDDRK